MLSQKPVLRVIALSTAFLILSVSNSNAQGKDMGVGFCAAHGQYTGTSCPKCASGNTTSTSSGVYRVSRAQKKAMKAAQLDEEANNANDKGVAFYNKQDCSNAVIEFQEAANLNPKDKIIQQNLINAKTCLDQQRDAANRRSQEQLQQVRYQQWEQQNKTAVTNIQKNIQAFTQAVNTASSTTGLDFIGKTADTTSGNTTTNTSLQFGDPNIVDTSKSPSGLPKAIYDNCIVTLLEHIANDTYAIKFYNKCDSNYIVRYQIIDPVKIFYPSDINVASKNGNTPGTIHCSDNAAIKIISKVSY